MFTDKQLVDISSRLNQWAAKAIRELSSALQNEKRPLIPKKDVVDLQDETADSIGISRRNKSKRRVLVESSSTYSSNGDDQEEDSDEEDESSEEEKDRLSLIKQGSNWDQKTQLERRRDAKATTKRASIQVDSSHKERGLRILTQKEHMLSMFHTYQKNRVKQLSFSKTGELKHSRPYTESDDYKEHIIQGLAIVNIFIGQKDCCLLHRNEDTMHVIALGMLGSTNTIWRNDIENSRLLPIK